jgi:hypothetical protein
VRLNQELVCTAGGKHDRERDFGVTVPETRSTTKRKNLKQSLNVKASKYRSRSVNCPLLAPRPTRDGHDNHEVRACCYAI